MRRHGDARIMLVFLMVALCLAGCAGRLSPREKAALSIKDVQAEVVAADGGQTVMQVEGTIVNDGSDAVALDKLPQAMQDDEVMDTAYEFSGEKTDELEARRSLTFTATAPFDPSVEHEWRFAAAEGTEVMGLDESARVSEAFHVYLGETADEDAESATETAKTPSQDYQLQEVVVLARHNVRAPLSTNGSVLSTATPNEWIEWTAPGSELTLRGGALETVLGQYMRTWLEEEGLFPANYQPAQGEVRFYANSKQRTMATAQYFSSGLLPVANVEIETNASFDEMDPVFTPKLTFVSDDYAKAVQEQMAELHGVTNVADIASGFEDAFALIEDVIDYQSSPGYRSGELGELATNDTEVTLELGKEPGTNGSFKLACQLADALVLQYYEEPDAQKAAFGHDLTDEQWRTISSAKDAYVDALYATPLVATNVAHPLLQEIGRELDLPARKFTFLCGHDSNVTSVLTALGVEEYELPDAVETKTPIGCMVLFEKWTAEDGQTYGKVRLVYQSVEQLRGLTLFEGGEEPCSVDLSFAGLEKNDDGLYAYDDLRGHIDEASAEYYRIRDQYGTSERTVIEEDGELPAAA